MGLIWDKAGLLDSVDRRSLGTLYLLRATLFCCESLLIVSGMLVNPERLEIYIT